MANNFNIGEQVRQVVPVIKGTVKAKQFIENDICCLVEYVGADGEKHERMFKESELEKAV